MRMRRDEPMSAEAERELEALDRALAGEGVEPELANLAALATALRAERPDPREDWGVGLDLQVSSGFGRAGKPAWRRLLGDRRPLTLLAPAGALATLVVVAAVGIGVSQDGDDDAGGEGNSAAEIQPAAPDAGGGAVAEEGGVAFEASEGPSVGARQSLKDVGAVESSEPADGSALALPGATADIDTGYRRDSSRLAPGRQNRVEDRSAALVLQTETPKVREVSDQAISIVQGSGGIVVSSSLTERGKRAYATLELSIPTRSLDATLEQLTGLATVKSLSEGSVDITRPFVWAEDELKDARAERKQLLEALGNATTDFEAEAIRKQLDDARDEISRAEAEFENIARRGRLADVSLNIEGKPADDDGSWSLGEAADDALDALETVAGVLLITTAILVPLGLLIAIVAFAVLALRRRRRERALED